MTKKFFATTLAALTVFLTGCGGDIKSVDSVTAQDPGRVTTVTNTEIVVRKIGNTGITYIGDVASRSCVAESTKVVTTIGGADMVSVSITAAPPAACGFLPEPIVTYTEWVPTCTPCAQSKPQPKPKASAPPCQAQPPIAPPAVAAPPTGGASAAITPKT